MQYKQGLPVFQTEVIHFLQQAGHLHDAVLTAEEEGALQLGFIAEPLQQSAEAVVGNLHQVHTDERPEDLS